MRGTRTRGRMRNRPPGRGSGPLTIRAIYNSRWFKLTHGPAARKAMTPHWTYPCKSLTGNWLDAGSKCRELAGTALARACKPHRAIGQESDQNPDA